MEQRRNREIELRKKVIVGFPALVILCVCRGYRIWAFQDEKEGFCGVPLLRCGIDVSLVGKNCTSYSVKFK